MTIGDLTKGISHCACGKKHICPIDSVVVSRDAMDRLVVLCEAFCRILVVSDENTYRIQGETVYKILGERVERSLVLTQNGDVVIPNEEKITEICNAVTDRTDLIIGVGSGVINDLCKIVSFERDLPYYIVATAPSMDGYASVGAALILNGMKVTKNARPPKAILADPAVLKDAPMEMLRAGYGDICGKYSCLNDWKLSALLFDEYFCQTVYDLTMDAAAQVKALAEGIVKRNEDAVKTLMEALIVVGIAMSYVGTSRPASGSEHHLSHFFEITGILHDTPYLMHGIDVAYSSVVTAALRERILASAPQKQSFDRDQWERDIRRIYSDAADGVIALQDKLDWYERDDYAVVKAKWEDIKTILAEAPTAQETQEMMERVGLCYADFETQYGEEKIADAVRYGKDLKDRYSVLWLYNTCFGA